MILWDLLQAAQFDQEFSIYVTNAYGQNIPVVRGRITDMFKLDEGEYKTFDHIVDKVEYFHITDTGRMVVFLRDEHYDEDASWNYSDEYVSKWDNFNPKSRPWLHAIETEEYTEEYIYKFTEGAKS